MDVVSADIRSRMMSGIRGKNTRPERLVRSGLFAAGYRFRLHQRQLPGVPDVVIARRRVAIFVHGCFWHQHAGCRYAARPKSNYEFWNHKLARNVERDQLAVSQLAGDGWRVLVIWECATRDIRMMPVFLRRVAKWIEGSGSYLEIPDLRRKSALAPHPVAKRSKAWQPGLRTKRELATTADLGENAGNRSVLRRRRQ